MIQIDFAKSALCLATDQASALPDRVQAVLGKQITFLAEGQSWYRFQDPHLLRDVVDAIGRHVHPPTDDGQIQVGLVGDGSEAEAYIGVPEGDRDRATGLTGNSVAIVRISRKNIAWVAGQLLGLLDEAEEADALEIAEAARSERAEEVAAKEELAHQVGGMEPAGS